MKNFIKILILIWLLMCTTACGKPEVEDVKAKMETHLLEKYGEPFVVENIGLRDENGRKFYEARVYPKSIIGTPREADDYYYGSASIYQDEVKLSGNNVGDDYSFINRNEDVENYLLPKAKELFGDRIRMKVDVNHEKTGGDRSYWMEYKSKSLQQMREHIKENPRDNRILLTLYLYVFDKIDSEKEKEERRAQIFNFVQYLKKEGLFEYTILDTMIIDERVLTPSYETYEYQLKNGERTSQIVEEVEYYLLPLELRKEVISELDNELHLMKSKSIEKSINELLKSDLTDETDYTEFGIIKGNIQWLSRIYSEKNVKEEFKGAYEQGEIKLSLYDKVSDIEFKKYSKYNFVEN